MSKKTKIYLGIILVILVGFSIYQFSKKWGVSSSSEKKEVKVESKQEKITRELGSKYNAVVDWGKNIKYSVQLQEALVNSGKPILFVGYVEDVLKENNKYFIVFTTDYLTVPYIRFTLECPEDKISEILGKVAKNPDDSTWGLFGDYIVVAKINDVKKTKLQISGSVNGEDVELEYSSSDVFIANGSCIDFSYIGED